MKLKQCYDVTSRVEGLMNDEVYKYDGAHFMFPEIGFPSFWGKNTLEDLDVAFLDPTGIIQSIKTIEAGNLTPVQSDTECMEAIELRKGKFAELGLEPGDKFPFKKAKIANNDKIQWVLDRLPVDVYQVVFQTPVEVEESTSGHTEGKANFDRILIKVADDGMFEYVLAHEYAHIFIMKSGRFDRLKGMGKLIFEYIDQKLNNTYMEEEAKNIAQTYMQRHMDLDFFSGAQINTAIYEEMFADSLAKMVVGDQRPASDFAQTYAQGWLENFIYDKLGSKEEGE